MMYLKKHLLRAEIVKGAIISLFFLNSCVESTKPNKYVARVNDSYLTEAELYELADTGKASSSNIKEVIKNWVRNELLYQQAEDEGIVDTEDFEKIIEESRKRLAGALLLKKIVSDYSEDVKQAELEEFYNKNKNNFTLSTDHYLLNRAKFSDYLKAVQFRSSLISAGWSSAVKNFENDTSLTNKSDSTLYSEHEIHPVQILRVVQDLYPLEISIVISDEPGYYSVLEVLDKFEKGSIPPFSAIKQQVAKRLLAEKEKIAVEEYIEELYLKNEIEINY